MKVVRFEKKGQKTKCTKTKFPPPPLGNCTDLGQFFQRLFSHHQITKSSNAKKVYGLWTVFEQLGLL